MAKSKTIISTKRIYEKPSPEDGFRIYVDRLWPRGLTKKKAKIDLWLKDIAPSTGLRKWFNHDPEKWTSFKRKYHRELKHNSEALNPVKELMGKGHVTLLFSSKEFKLNNAEALVDYLKRTKSRI